MKRLFTICTLILFSIQLFGQNLFKVPKDVIWGINEAYKPMQGPLLYGESFYRLVDLASDDITYSEPIDEDAVVDDLGFNANIDLLNNIYNALITGVQRANLVIDNSPTVSMDPQIKQRVIAEAKFLRAFYYWHLTTIFGEVPLYSKFPSVESEMFIPKSSEEKIYNQMISDLKDAENILPINYTGENVGRATKYAATALLGKIYLFQKRWADAASKLGELVNSATFSLTQNYKDNFGKEKENNSESIFELQHTDILTGSVGVYFSEGGISSEGNERGLYMGIKSNGVGIGFSQIIVTRDLFNEFEPNDPRLKETVWLIGDTSLIYLTGSKKGYTTSMAQNVKVGQTGVETIGKYFHAKKGLPGYTSVISGNNPENWRIIRLADIYLMYAEALAESGDLNTASVQLNKVRARARGTQSNILPDFPYTSIYGGNKPYLTATAPSGTVAFFAGDTVKYGLNIDDFRRALVHERRVELATEYHRYFDLLRWDKIPGHPGAATKVFSEKRNPEDKKNFITGTHQKFPFNTVTITQSKGTLIQNPGY